MTTLLQDVRHSCRTFKKSPAFSLTAVLILAIGIGATTALFSVVNNVLLRPLNYPGSERLYVIHEIIPQMIASYPYLDANLPDFEIWKQQAHAFDDLAIVEDSAMILSGVGEPEQLRITRASANFLEMLGAQAALGRLFRPEEDIKGHGYVTVLTDSLWHSRFSGDPSIVGRSITLDGTPHIVVGVLPGSFRLHGGLNGFSSGVQLFTPLNGPRWFETGLIGEFDFTAIGRLRRGVTATQAAAELNAIQAGIGQQAHEGVDLRAELVLLQKQLIGRSREGLLLLLAAVVGVLLLICINLANLLLARVPARLRDAGIRKALGASDARMFRQTIIETLLLTLIASGCGIAVAYAAVRAFVRFGPADIPRLSQAHIDAGELCFALGISALTALLVGAIPSWVVSRASLSTTLASVGRSASEGPRARNLRGGLVFIQMGTCTILLIMAGLLARSVEKLLNLDPGFRVDHLLTAEIQLPPVEYKRAAPRTGFYDGALASIRSLPGVQSAAYVHILPLSGGGSDNGVNYVDRSLPAKDVPDANFRVVSPQYFKTMGIPLLAGRVLNEGDHNKLRVVISQNLAQRLWPNQDVIGKQCIAEWVSSRQPSEIIGVVGDVRSRLERPPTYMVYVADSYAAQPEAGREGKPMPPGSATFVIKTGSDPVTLSNSVRDAIHSAGPDVPIVALRPMSQVVAAGVQGREFQMLLISCFALSALLLAALGVIGVLAYSVEQRTREFGIRGALGAQRSDLLLMVIRQGMLPVFFGVAAGVIVALATGTFVRGMVFGISTLDPLTFVAISLLVIAVGILAAYVPAMRATRIDPMVALRHE
jgi:putative ABC transport system permease protein